MILSDGEIELALNDKDITIEPFDIQNIQPASYDFALGNRFLVFRNHTAAIIDPLNKPSDLMSEVVIQDSSQFILHPGEFVLATSVERFALSDEIVARVEGKSSLGRLGLLIHATAGFVDPGWPLGQITLELSNVATLPIALTPGMRIGQMSFQRLGVPSKRPYGHPILNSKYVGQDGPVASRYGDVVEINAHEEPATLFHLE